MHRKSLEAAEQLSRVGSDAESELKPENPQNIIKPPAKEDNEEDHDMLILKSDPQQLRHTSVAQLRARAISHVKSLAI